MKVELRALRLLCAVFFFGYTNLASASCIISYANQSDVADEFAQEVADQLKVSVRSVALGLTTPMVTQLVPIGDDCSGTDSIFFSSSYSFDLRSQNATCYHRGVVILKGFSLTADIEVQDSSTCIGIPQTGPQLAGEYINLNTSPRHIKRVVISKNNRFIQVFGACGGGECDWGRAALTSAAPGTMKAVFNDSAAKRELQVVEGMGTMDLEIHTKTTYHDGRGTKVLIDSFYKN